ncbi:hypothetical protein CRV03_03730 [Arcobacter sp. F155]|uniref:hypothetical protein n=1 Tax=unclassified Arcobacter TaxID=2593671 RepID=UPI00100A24D4|nr:MULTISPECIES: hypothetical protein [unclassified Arcobacter]RXJ78093.1 hypothetical protein CRV03_03730 [Arcobacter sp. F155]RXK03846.1 hypothetical protein CRV02_01225 [Arcobacter sp. CECT 8989]
MNDRLHEILGEIGIIHKSLLDNQKIDDVEYVLEYLDGFEDDVKDHYLKLLLQYYFQQNNLNNVKELLLLGYKFDLRMEDIKLAFLNIKSNEENVIDFLDDNVVFLKDSNMEEPLKKMYTYYMENEALQATLEETVELLKRNRYICAYAYKNRDYDFARFFLNEDLLQSLKEDMPYLLK